jgi:hypothetical protein
MPRPRKPVSPFRYFNSSYELIRLVVLMYARFPLSLRNVETCCLNAASTYALGRYGCGRTGSGPDGDCARPRTPLFVANRSACVGFSDDYDGKFLSVPSLSSCKAPRSPHRLSATARRRSCRALRSARIQTGLNNTLSRQLINPHGIIHGINEKSLTK